MRNKIVVLLLASLMKTISIYGIDTGLANTINSQYNQQLNPNTALWSQESLMRARTALGIYNTNKAELQKPENHDWHAKVIQLIIFYQQLIQLDSGGGLTQINLNTLNNVVKAFKKEAGLDDFVNERPVISAIQSIMLIMKDAIKALSLDTTQARNCFYYLIMIFSAFDTSVVTDRDMSFFMRKAVELKNDPTMLDLLKKFGQFIRDNQDDNWRDLFYGQRPHVGNESIVLGFPKENLDAIRDVFIKTQQELRDLIGTPAVTPTPSTPAPTPGSLTPSPSQIPFIPATMIPSTPAPTPAPADYTPPQQQVPLTPAPTVPPTTTTPVTPSAPPYVATPQYTYVSTPVVTPTPTSAPVRPSVPLTSETGALVPYVDVTKPRPVVTPGVYAEYEDVERIIPVGTRPVAQPYTATITPATQEQLNNELRRLQIRVQWLKGAMSSMA